MRGSDENRRCACTLCSGRLYNKTSILEYKLSKDERSETSIKAMAHIRGLKDVKELQLTDTPGHVMSFRPAPGLRPRRWISRVLASRVLSLVLRLMLASSQLLRCQQPCPPHLISRFLSSSNTRTHTHTHYY